MLDFFFFFFFLRPHCNFSFEIIKFTLPYINKLHWVEANTHTHTHAYTYTHTCSHIHTCTQRERLNRWPNKQAIKDTQMTRFGMWDSAVTWIESMLIFLRCKGVRLSLVSKGCRVVLNERLTRQALVLVVFRLASSAFVHFFLVKKKTTWQQQQNTWNHWN